jgi:hypothetical protein
VIRPVPIRGAIPRSELASHGSRVVAEAVGHPIECARLLDGETRAFRLHLSGAGCYGPRGEELTFRSIGRAFYAFASLGSAAPRRSVRLLEHMLDSFRVGTRHLHPLVFRNGRAGLAFTYPALWSVTRTRLDAITSPPQLVAVASYPLAVRPSKDSCPHPALARRPAGGVYVQLREETNARIARSFPARPRKFSLQALGQVECYGPRSARIRFRDAGRGFYAYLSVGPRATDSSRRTTLRLLDGLHIALK